MLALAKNQRIPAPLKTRRRLLLGYTDAGRGSDAGCSGPDRARDRRYQIRQIVGDRIALRAVDRVRVFSADCRSRRRLHLPWEALPGVTVLAEQTRCLAPEICSGRCAMLMPASLLIFRVPRMNRNSNTCAIFWLEWRPLRLRTGLPHRIVIDEAHYFLHDRDVKELLDLELGSLYACNLQGFPSTPGCAGDCGSDYRDPRIGFSRGLRVARALPLPARGPRMKRSGNNCSGTLLSARLLRFL